MGCCLQKRWILVDYSFSGDVGAYYATLLEQTSGHITLLFESRLHQTLGPLTLKIDRARHACLLIDM